MPGVFVRLVEMQQIDGSGCHDATPAAPRVCCS